MIWLALVFGGLGTVFSSEARFPPIVGWLALAIAAVVAVLTMERWVRVLPAFLAYGVFNGLFMIATGHLVNDASKTVPPGTAVIITLLGAGATLVGISLASHKPTWVDRLAALGVFASLLVGLVNERLTVWSFGLMFCCLAVAWWTERALRRHHRARNGSA